MDYETYIRSVLECFFVGYADAMYNFAVERIKAYEPEGKKGKWIDREVYDADRWKCSECGRTEQYKENYCPNCGADMREAENE